MNQFEFLQVVKEIRVTFERVERRIASLEKDNRAEQFLDVWFRLLKDVTKDEALDAVQVLLFSETKPREVEDFALKIRRIAKERSPKEKAEYSNGQRVYKCADCLGEAWISVFIPPALFDGVVRTYTKFCNGNEQLAIARARGMTTNVRCGKCRSEPSDVLAYEPMTMTKWTYPEMRKRNGEADSLESNSNVAQEIAVQELPPASDSDAGYIAEMNAQAEALAEREAIQNEG